MRKYLGNTYLYACQVRYSGWISFGNSLFSFRFLCRRCSQSCWIVPAPIFKCLGVIMDLAGSSWTESKYPLPSPQQWWILKAREDSSRDIIWVTICRVCLWIKYWSRRCEPTRLYSKTKKGEWQNMRNKMWGGEEGHGQEASHLWWIYLFKLFIFFTKHYSFFFFNMCTHFLIL